MDLSAYRAEAEMFASALSREHYRHFAGLTAGLAIEPIYAAHAGLFTREAVERLREAGSRPLLEFAVEGLIGAATRAEATELAELEAALEVELSGERMPYRGAVLEQANEPDPDRRAALAAAREAVVSERLDPLLRETLERSHALARDLGWRSMKDMCATLSGIDLDALGRACEAFLEATDDRLEPVARPALERELGFGFERLRRSDLPTFFRAPSLDAQFPADRLLASLERTVDGLGVGAGGRVLLDTEARPTKSPRAFCAPVRVPDEVHLVIAQNGGRDDYEALLHEAGHAYHYAHVDRARPFEDRFLGDNSITEAFAFLLQRLSAEPEWLRRRLAIDDVAPITAQSRASTLVFLRRYAAKLAYELELHDRPRTLDALRPSYARRLSRALHVEWPAATWLEDVDPFFYAARYLRAWSLESLVARALTERFGPAWFDEREAGRLLERLWASGQALGPEDMLAELGVKAHAAGFEPLLDEMAGWA